MAYGITGTAGNDTLNQSTDAGSGTIAALGGNDSIVTGLDSVQAFGGSGNDTVLLQPGNVGSIFAGTENDCIYAPGGTGPMQLFGNEGADTIVGFGWAFGFTPAVHTIVGGNDSADGNDSISATSIDLSLGDDLIFGNGGDDTILDLGGNNTLVAGFGNDRVGVQANSSLVFGNEGNDSVSCFGGIGFTEYGGLGNDIAVTGMFDVLPLLFFGNEGGDTLDTSLSSVSTATIVGGNDSADGADSVVFVGNNLFFFGNGGDDTITGMSSGGAGTLVGGHGADLILLPNPALNGSLFFGNEDNDTIFAYVNNATIFGGLGNDSITTGPSGTLLHGNEGNDTIVGTGLDTISGGSGNDVFMYQNGGVDDGNNAAGGGPVEWVTDVNWAEDRFDTTPPVTFAANMGAATGINLATSANNAINAAAALGVTQAVAAQFTFGGRTYLAINTDLVAGFNDPTDLLIDITGFTGAIGSSNFI